MSYGIGPTGYDNWLVAIDEYGSSHGNWWNATVYAECRHHAGKYLAEIGQWFPAMAIPANALAQAYADIADGLFRASAKEMPAAEKKALVAELKAQELATESRLEHLISKI